MPPRPRRHPRRWSAPVAPRNPTSSIPSQRCYGLDRWEPAAKGRAPEGACADREDRQRSEEASRTPVAAPTVAKPAARKVQRSFYVELMFWKMLGPP